MGFIISGLFSSITFILLFIVLPIFFVFALFHGTAGRNRDIFYENYESPDINERRTLYESMLKKYYNDYAPRLYLKNDLCELKLILKGPKTYFYCKEKQRGYTKGRYFEIKGNAEHCNTMWGIFDMEFDEFTNYDSIKIIYRSVNNDMRYFSENMFDKYPHISDNIAQNEYCRMEFKEENGENYIICYDLWNHEPCHFKIKAGKYTLLHLIRNFKENDNKMQTIFELLRLYEKRTELEVKLIREPIMLETKRIPKKQTSVEKKESAYDTYTENGVKYIKTDIKETPSEAAQNVSNEQKNASKEQEKSKIDNYKQEEQNDIKETKKYKKFKERKLDL